MIKPKKEAVLLIPKNIKSSNKFLKVIGVMNPAAIRLKNGDIMLYVRVVEIIPPNEDKKYCYAPRLAGKEDYDLVIDRFEKKETKQSSPIDILFKDDTKRLKFVSHLRRVILSPDGFKIKSIDSEPSFYGLSWDGELSVEDPRITKIDEQYVMTYVTLSRKESISSSIAISKDCINWFRRGIIFEQQNKDAVIFPEKIGDYYYAFNRPEGNFEFSSPHLWLSRSRDLEIWGKSKGILLSEDKKSWDSKRVGAGCPPIKTKHGWLLIYHGVLGEASTNEVISKRRIKYVAGAALFDLKNPDKLIAKTPKPFLLSSNKICRNPIEKKDVIFPTGAVMDKNGKDLIIYSGAGDYAVIASKFSLNGILKSMKKV